MQTATLLLRRSRASRLHRALIAVIACVSIAHASDGHGRRVALVIGNGNYQQSLLPKLSNPAHDAQDIAKALRGFGFEVIEREDQTLENMNAAIAEFGSKIGGSEAALFYFAGHGIQVKNQNYLIAVNAKIESEASVPYQGVNVNQILDEMDNGKASANIVMLDACRNNPITGKFRSGQTRGLASPASTPKGTVIIYATDPGNVASDGKGRNGLFTAGLLTAFKGKDLSLDGVLTVASAEVEQASSQTQTPYVNGPKTLQKTFNFRVSVEPGSEEIERTFWKSIEFSTDAADFAAYLQKYPMGSYAGLAENRLKRLQGGQETMSSGRPSGAYDGRWAVSLVCEDFADKAKVAKGYTSKFVGDVREGRLTGQQGQVGRPSSLTMVGSIQADGTAQLKVSGLTGDPEFTVGQVQPSTPFGFTMRGSFTQFKGKAQRVELRPCEATFLKR